MKNTIKYLGMAVIALMLSACQEDKLDPVSVITVRTTEKNDFDYWLESNFLKPYNIEFKYRYEANESDMNYYTVPAEYEYSIMMAHLVKYLCIDTYDEVAGVDFTRANFPKLFFLIGDWEYRNNGTIILGTAEGGKKINLAGVNHLPTYLARGAEALNEYYIKTIHHEFTHILNQTKSYQTDFKLITGNGYIADDWSVSPNNTGYLTRGFISAYSQYSDTEDFAEMLSIYIISSPEQWDAWMNEAGTSGASFIRSKLELVRAYMQESWDVDIDELRTTILRRQDDVINGLVDLTDLTIR